MSEVIAQAIERLNRQLPLKRRHDALEPGQRRLHRQVIESLVGRGRLPSREEMSRALGGADVDAAIRALGAADVAVLSADGREIVGAYPVTTEVTPHELRVNGHRIHAMCALDAVSVGPMFDVRVEIRSSCRMCATPVHIVQDGMRVLNATPAGVRVGVRWQMPCGHHAAHSMCREMVFLANDACAAAWHGGDLDRHSVFDLDDAVAFGAGNFRPLL